MSDERQVALGYSDEIYESLELPNRKRASSMLKHPTLSLHTHHGDSLEVPTPRDDVTKAVWMLYTSRCLAAWGQRFWSFGSALFMFALRPEDLILVSVLGLALNLARLLLIPTIGSWIDNVGRLKAARTLLVVQNLSIACACTLFAVYFKLPGVMEAHFLIVVAATTVLAVLASLASAGIKILMERDWIVVIAGHDDALLAKTNSVFQSIDLSCKTLAPIAAGVLLSWAGYYTTAIVLAAWNVISALIELTLLTMIYTEFRGLRWKPKPEGGKKKRRFGGSCGAWSLFMTHDIRNAGLSLSCLYMTVLGFDSVTWAYTLLQGIPEWQISVFVGVGAVIGILGTVLFPRLRSACGVERTGMLGMCILVSCQALCVVAIWLPGSPFPLARNHSGSYLSIAFLIGGITSARLGLWLADISIMQITQENVEAQNRGKIGGVQTALNSLVGLIKFCLTLGMPKETQFGYLVLASYACIVTGALLFISYGIRAIGRKSRERQMDETTPLLFS